MPKDPFGDPEFQSTLRRELRRIRARGDLLSGMATSVPITVDQILAAFRATPDGAGNEAFLAALDAQLSADDGEA